MLLTFLAYVTSDGDTKPTAVLLELDGEALHLGQVVRIHGQERDVGSPRRVDDEARSALFEKRAIIMVSTECT